MTKKLLAIILSLTVSLSAFAFVGCGSDTFSADYKSATATQVNAFASEVNALDRTSALDFAVGGYKLTADLEEQSTLNGEMELDGTALISIDEYGKIKGYANGELEKEKLNGLVKEETEINGKAYYQDGYVYLNGYMEKTGQTRTVVKSKSKYDLETIVSQINVKQYLHYVSVINAIQGSNAKLYMGEKQNGKVIKLVANNFDVGAIVSMVSTYDLDCVFTGSIFLALDNDYKILGVKIDADVNLTVDGATRRLDIDLTLDKFSGKVTFPNDLDDYERDDFDDDEDFFDGSYTLATANDLTYFNTNYANKTFDLYSGNYEGDVELDVTLGGLTINWIDNEYKLITVDGVKYAIGEVEVDFMATNFTANGDFYYDGTYAYMKKGEGVTAEKSKMQVAVSEIVDLASTKIINEVVNIDKITLAYQLGLTGDGVAVKVNRDNGITKVQVVMTGVQISDNDLTGTFTGSWYYAFDSENNLVGYAMDFNCVSSFEDEQFTATLDAEFIKYNGTIVAPNDLNTYALVQM